MPTMVLHRHHQKTLTIKVDLTWTYTAMIRISILKMDIETTEISPTKPVRALMTASTTVETSMNNNLSIKIAITSFKAEGQEYRIATLVLVFLVRRLRLRLQTKEVKVEGAWMSQMSVVGVHSIGEVITVQDQATFQVNSIDLMLIIIRPEVDRQIMLGFWVQVTEAPPMLA